MDGVALLAVQGLGEFKPGRWYYDLATWANLCCR